MENTLIPIYTGAVVVGALPFVGEFTLIVMQMLGLYIETPSADPQRDRQERAWRYVFMPNYYARFYYWGDPDKRWQDFLSFVQVFRPILVGLIAFGIAGGGLLQVHPLLSLVGAVLAGAGGMVGTAWMVEQLNSGRSTRRITMRAGMTGTVVQTVPAAAGNGGTITLNFPGHTEEYEAVSPGRELAAGTVVLIVEVTGKGDQQVAVVQASGTTGMASG